MNEDIKVIIFEVANEKYGVQVEHDKTIERLTDITRVPNLPSFVKGVMNLRGVIVPIIDLRGRLDLEEKEPTTESRIIVVNCDDVEVGLIVDSANDVADLQADQIDRNHKRNFIDGIAKVGEDILVLLNLTAVLNKEELFEVKNTAFV